ncbi:hypothetical protein [Methylosinus trichosporium]|uniref:Aminotransferase class V-fold PLP-dependent enzyme n=2 Tax=Methylocystaceae TaxID=31993 RepID=A0A2D2D3I0_METT3|nr:hypothetical protein [Methylosinus trichosporium]ATQ69537.1 hypothetical protein CQW49_17865 [Methylosinus trichosporium OB3b]OBS50502.1 hypothetical protein A8B73_21330 [Methylosinus sp. 3S-1]
MTGQFTSIRRDATLFPPQGSTRNATDAAKLGFLLATGGDERIAIDGVSRRNRYGVSPEPGVDEIFFSSSTASSTSPIGFKAALDAWRALKDGANAADWFETLRVRIRRAYGTPDCDVVLAPSGTETEYLALALALNAVPGPLTNLVVAPEETGRGVSLAAHGAHFLSTGPFRREATPGRRLPGLERADIEVEPIEIREGSGCLRDPECIDEDALRVATEALARGRSLLVHHLAVSKTGQSGLALHAINRICSLAPERVTVIADCCQLRSTPRQVRALLDCGFLVAVTGSKFAGGPPFCGALLIPAAFTAKLRGSSVPKGLWAHSSPLDWPMTLRVRLGHHSQAEANFGLGLRWAAALVEIERFLAVPSIIAQRAQARFKGEVLELVGACPSLAAVVDERSREDFADTIIPIKARGVGGDFLNDAELLKLKSALLAPLLHGPAELQRAIHVGQPVTIGTSSALRVCMSAPIISDFSERLEGGEAFDAAFEPISSDLRLLFEKLRRIMACERRRDA